MLFAPAVQCQSSKTETEDDKRSGFRDLSGGGRGNICSGKQPIALIHMAARRVTGFPMIEPAPTDKCFRAAKAWMCAEAMVIEIVEFE